LLSRAIAHGQKIFRLQDELQALVDHRVKPEIPAAVFAQALLMLWLCRLPSLNALDLFGRRGAGRRFLRPAMPSADQLANISEILDVPGLRANPGAHVQATGPPRGPAAATGASVGRDRRP